MMVEIAVKAIIKNQYFRTYVIAIAYVLLYFMYAKKDIEPELARDINYIIHINQILFTSMQGILSLTWYFDTSNKPQKALFLSFSVFCLLRLLYRFYAIVFDEYMVTSSPMYFMMLFVVGVLIYLERKYGSD